MSFWDTVLSGIVVLVVWAAVIAIWKNKDVTLRRIRRRADSIKWLPCWVFGHVDPGMVDYERGDHCICERCGKRLD